MPFAAKSFYKTTITNYGVQRQLEKQRIVLPNPEISEDEIDTSDDEDVGFEIIATNEEKSNRDGERSFGEHDTFANDSSEDGDENDISLDTSSNNEEAGPSNKEVLSKPGKASYRCLRSQINEGSKCGLELA